MSLDITLPFYSSPFFCQKHAYFKPFLTIAITVNSCYNFSLGIKYQLAP